MHRKWDVFTQGSNFNCCTAPGKNLCIAPSSLWSRSAPRGSTDVFQGFDNKVLTLQICLYWAVVHIPTLITLKHLMPVSSMWLGPLVAFCPSRLPYFQDLTKIFLIFSRRPPNNMYTFLHLNRKNLIMNSRLTHGKKKLFIGSYHCDIINLDLKVAWLVGATTYIQTSHYFSRYRRT